MSRQQNCCAVSHWFSFNFPIMAMRLASRKSAAMSFEQIAVVGGGAWGTALALTCARAGRAVSLWEADPANAAHLAVHRESRFLPGVRLDNRIAVVADLAEAARAAGPASGRAGASCPRGDQGIGAAVGGRHPGDRLRQGHRARHAEIHDRCGRSNAHRSPRPPFYPGRALRPTWRMACRPRSRWRPPTRHWPPRLPRRSARPPSGPIAPPTCAGSSLAAPPRMCWPSRPAW